jgi:bacterioferritin (cytochrome b1)
MLEKQEKLQNQFLLTAEQKIALMEAKVARAEEQIKSLAEQASLFEKAREQRYTKR